MCKLASECGAFFCYDEQTRQPSLVSVVNGASISDERDSMTAPFVQQVIFFFFFSSDLVHCGGRFLCESILTRG